MSVSLLDLLSCGLAAVVIMLMLSLNSGFGNGSNLDESTYVELTVHGGGVGRFFLKWREKVDTMQLSIKESFYYLDLSSEKDSLLGLRVTAFDKASEQPGLSSCRVLQLAIPPKARGLELGIETYEEIGDYVIEYYATNTFEPQQHIKSELCEKLIKPAKINLKYLGGTKVWITDRISDNIICSFPTLANER